MKQILVLYFSGAGASEKVAEMIAACLQKEHKVELLSIEDASGVDLNRYHAFVIGTPVYHAAPSLKLIEYFEQIHPLDHKKPAFLYNTRATWSCNTNRILAKLLIQKNIMTVMDRDYRSPASDGSLLVPFVRRFFEFDKELKRKINRDCLMFSGELEKHRHRGYLPRFRMSSIINAPNKLAGQLTTFRIHLHRERCIRCGKCIRECPHQARKIDREGYPTFISRMCENCYRCIHHCPGKALSLSRRKAPEKLLEYQS